jgi:hypothetical protein
MSTTLLCPVCQDPLVGRDHWRCPSCATPHHDSCRQYAGRCATYGCAAAPPAERSSLSFRTPSRYVDEADSWITSAVLLVNCAVAGLVVSSPALRFYALLLPLFFVACCVVAGLACSDGLVVEVDEAAGTLLRRSVYPLGVSRDRLVRLDRLAAARPRLRVRLVEGGNLGTYVSLEVDGIGPALRPRLAACPVADWPELRPVARGLAAALKTDLEVPPALAA